MNTNTIPDLPALSIRQPWAWLILNGGKDIENRTRRTHYRGRFLIHAAKGCTRLEYENAVNFALMRRPGLPIPLLEDLPRGGIVGEAEIIDCVTATRDPWFVGPFGYLLLSVKPLPFTPCVGALGFFRPKLTP